MSAQSSNSAGTAFRLAKVDVTGAALTTPAAVLTMSGLHVGQTVTTAALDAAVERLSTTP